MEGLAIDDQDLLSEEEIQKFLEPDPKWQDENIDANEQDVSFLPSQRLPKIFSQLADNDKELITVRFPWNTFAAKNHGSTLSRAVTTNNFLTDLDLSMNGNFGDVGLNMLKGALTNNASITRLGLKACSIADRGASDISTALRSNSTITSLNLDDNEVSNDGAEALANCLGWNCALTDLSLRWNCIHTQGAKSLCSSLQINLTLTAINLEMNHIGDHALVDITEALQDNQVLTALNLGWNSNGVAEARYMPEEEKYDHAYIDYSKFPDASEDRSDGCDLTHFVGSRSTTPHSRSHTPASNRSPETRHRTPSPRPSSKVDLPDQHIIDHIKSAFPDASSRAANYT